MAALAVPIAMRAQPPRDTPKFEIASIKRNPGGAPSSSVELGLMRAIARGSRSGRFYVPNAPLHLLIRLAYDVRDYQIVGEPSWAASDGYAVTVYELAPAKGGLKIAPAKAGSCVSIDPRGPAPPFGSKICGGERVGIGRVEGFGVTMPKLVELLSDRVGSPVIDRTGFRAAFDFQLDFAVEEGIGADPGPGPSIFAALQEQLGLRLEPAKGPVEVLLIDHVARPGEN
jgi:hypothetical protein